MSCSGTEFRKVHNFELFNEFKTVLKQYKFELVKEKSLITLIIKDLLKQNMGN